MRKISLIVFCALFICAAGCGEIEKSSAQPTVSLETTSPKPIFEIGLDLMESGARFPEINQQEYPHFSQKQVAPTPVRKVTELLHPAGFRILVTQQFFQYYQSGENIPQKSGVIFKLFTMNKASEILDSTLFAEQLVQGDLVTGKEGRLNADFSLSYLPFNTVNTPQSQEKWVEIAKINDKGMIEEISNN